MKTIEPDPKRLSEIFKNIPQDTPIVMLNMLKFRDRALYPDGTPDCSGREAYREYTKTAVKKVLAVGGRPDLFMARVHGVLIGPPDESWDAILLVEYPSIQAFKRMLAMPDYQACTIHRTAALEDSRLIATVKGDRVI